MITCFQSLGNAELLVDGEGCLGSTSLTQKTSVQDLHRGSQTSHCEETPRQMYKNI